MLYFRATQNGSRINYNSVGFDMPVSGTPNSNMQIFFGEWTDTTIAGAADSTLNWIVSTDSSWVWYDTSTVIDPDGSYTGYVNGDGDLNWINCDYFYNQTPQTTVSVNFSNSPDAAYYPEVYLVFDNINAITNLYCANYNCSVLSVVNIPEGLTGKLIAFTAVGGKYYFCKEPVTVTTNMLKTLTFQEVTEQELISQLSSL
jgi:hypothetical protein